MGRSAEPDVLIKYGDGIRSVAAERLVSRRKVESNIKKASAQIHCAGFPGYIFLDITRYMDPEAQYFEHWRHGHDAVRSRLNAFARMPVVTNRRNHLVHGVLLRASFPLVSPGFVFGTSEVWVAVDTPGGNSDGHIDLTRTLLTRAPGGSGVQRGGHGDPGGACDRPGRALRCRKDFAVAAAEPPGQSSLRRDLLPWTSPMSAFRVVGSTPCRWPYRQWLWPCPPWP